MKLRIGINVSLVLSLTFLLNYGLSGPVLAQSSTKSLSAPSPGTAGELPVSLQNLAGTGNSQAQFEIATRYTHGYGVPQNYKLAAMWFLRAAEQGHVESSRLLGDLHATGYGVTQDYNEAALRYEFAAINGNMFAQHSLALLHEKGLIPQAEGKKAFRYYKLAAQQGYADSQTNLGVLYQEGKIVPQDYKKAHQWYLRAATQNDSRAQNNLGTLYAKALGVQQDYSQAAKWYKLAANNGLANAMTNLGVLYENGFGVRLDEEEAKKWYRKAGNLSDLKSNSGQKSSPSDSLSSIESEANSGNPSAQYKLGQLYIEGRSVPQDFVIAYKWINLAAFRNWADSRELRDQLTKKMTPDQVNEAQALSIKSLNIVEP